MQERAGNCEDIGFCGCSRRCASLAILRASIRKLDRRALEIARAGAVGRKLEVASMAVRDASEAPTAAICASAVPSNGVTQSSCSARPAARLPCACERCPEAVGAVWKRELSFREPSCDLGQRGQSQAHELRLREGTGRRSREGRSSKRPRKRAFADVGEPSSQHADSSQGIAAARSPAQRSCPFRRFPSRSRVCRRGRRLS